MGPRLMAGPWDPVSEAASLSSPPLFCPQFQPLTPTPLALVCTLPCVGLGQVAQWYLTLRDPLDCSPPDSSVHGILQERILEWGAIAFSDILIGG